MSSSTVPRKPNRVRICSEVALGDTFVTCTTFVPELMVRERKNRVTKPNTE